MRDYKVLESLKAAQKTIINDAFDKGYEQGYNDGVKAKDSERGSLYHNGYGDGLQYGYKEGLKRGQELQAEETKCAEAYGMKRAWKAARKLRHMDYSTLYKVFEGDDLVMSDIRVKGLEAVFEKYSASEAVEKIDAWEKKKQVEKNCKNCAHRISEKRNFNETFFKCDAKGNCVNHEQWTPKQEQTEKKCRNCANSGEDVFACYECENYSNYESKQK